MEPVTHALSGVLVGRLSPKDRAVFWASLVSSIAPDLDYVSRFWGVGQFLRFHRGITHGIFALLIVPILVGLIFGRGKKFLKIFFFSFFSYGLHIFLDLTNSYGTRLISPLDWQPYALNLVFPIDIYIGILLLGGIIISYTGKRHSALSAVITIFLLFGYIGGKYYLKIETEEFLRQRLPTEITKVYPLPNGLLRWWVVAKKDGEFRTGLSDIFMRKVFLSEPYPPLSDDPAIEQSKKGAKAFLDIAGSPYPIVKRDGDSVEVIWKDLAHDFLPGERFTARVLIENGKIKRTYFKL